MKEEIGSKVDVCGNTIEVHTGNVIVCIFEILKCDYFG